MALVIQNFMTTTRLNGTTTSSDRVFKLSRAGYKKQAVVRCTNASVNRKIQQIFTSSKGSCQQVALATMGAVMASQILAAPVDAALLSGSGLEPSPLNLELKERIQEFIKSSKADLDKADFSHEDLVGAIFAETELKEANFEGSDMRASAFSRSVMYKANLSNSDLTDSMMDYVVLRGASVRGSILTNANFIRSDMGEMDVTDADFTDAIIDKYQLKSLCATASGTNPATGVDTRESLRCDEVTFYEGFNKGLKVEVKDASRK